MQVIILLTSGGMLEAYLDYTKWTHILKNYGDELLLITHICLISMRYGAYEAFSFKKERFSLDNCTDNWIINKKSSKNQ